MVSLSKLSQLSFDIDDYLTFPPPPWKALPYPISFFLGHREYPPPQYGNLLLTIRALLGVFTSLVLIQLVSRQVFDVAQNGPMVIGSFGAAAVLEFYAIESPFAQPRNFFVGQIIASVVGVSFQKLFQLRSDVYWIRWFGGALSCATTTALMGLTKTVHPPAGATALLAVVDDEAVALGWKLIPLVLLGCTIMLSVALVLNNGFGRFPVYWWTAGGMLVERHSKHGSSLSGDEEEEAISRQSEVVLVPDPARIVPRDVENNIQ
ncbi:HPP family protein [Xylariaceae sp. FL1272]|nr:HPP family protein [Xylariaceae sp. FL1272]